MNITYRVWGFQLGLQNFGFQNDDVVANDADGRLLGLKGLKPKAKNLRLLCGEHDLQGLGFPFGAPKPFFFKRRL